VVEEDRVSKLPKNHEAKRRRQEWELQDLTARKEAEERGEDYDRIKALGTQADMADRIDAAKRRRVKPDTGFASRPSQPVMSIHLPTHSTHIIQATSRCR